MSRLHVVLGVVCLSAAFLTGEAWAATGSLRVKVVNAAGDPVEVFAVQLWVETETGSRGFTFSAQPTETPGIFLVRDIPARHYSNLKINKSGYAPGWVDGIDIQPDEQTQATCTLDRGGTINGIVVDESGQPVAGITVVVNSVRCRRDVATDESGRFRAEYLLDTQYAVSAEPESGSPYAVTLLAARPRPGATDVRIVLKQKAETPSSAAIPKSASKLSPSDAEPSLDAIAQAALHSQVAARSELIGQPAPALVIERWYHGSFWQLSLRNRVVLLHFWGVWCGPCKRQIPEIRRLAKAHGDDGLVTIGIHTPFEKEKLPEFLAHNDLPYLIAVDHDGRTSKTYRIGGYPMIAVVDKKGILREFDPVDLEATIATLLAEAPQAAAQ